jgi:hypothetical protein
MNHTIICIMSTTATMNTLAIIIWGLVISNHTRRIAKLEKKINNE